MPASCEVSSDVPVIAERAMYRDERRMGHDSIGATEPEKNFYLAEGTTDYGFTTYVLVQNPGDDEASVELTYMTSRGPVPHPENPLVMPPGSRNTVRVNDFLPASDFSTVVSASGPIVAERAMYWGDADTGASHGSIGLGSPARRFYLPDGRVAEGTDTYVLVANPNGEPVEVKVTYLPADGGEAFSFLDEIPANSRRTYDMAKGIDSCCASAVVEARGASGGIAAERAVYFDHRGGGTCTIGARLDGR